MFTSMDQAKFERLISENMKSIFGFALTRLGKVNEADALASDIFARHSPILSHRRRSARVCRMAREPQAKTIE